MEAAIAECRVKLIAKVAENMVVVRIAMAIISIFGCIVSYDGILLFEVLK
jgi:hypothetical protein